MIMEQTLANSGLWAKSCLLPDFVNKVLLVHSHAHSCTYCLWLLLRYLAELSSLDRDCTQVACKASSVYYLALYEKVWHSG